MASLFDYLFGNKRKESDGKTRQDSSKSPDVDNPLRSFLLDIDHFEENLFKSNQKAADAGDAEAQFQTAVCCEQGTGTEKDYAKARLYYAMASMQGHSYATHNLGMLYYFGYGGEQDFNRAFSYFSSAATTGDPLALAALSVCYEQGRGTEQDAEEAEELMKKAMSQPNVSQGGLGILANNMRGVVIK